MENIGSKTKRNIAVSFANESQASVKYTYFADMAKQEGFDDIAKLFERMARNEREHARVWYKIISDGVCSTELNLLKAANDENNEWKYMYPKFAKEAREENNELAAVYFEKIAAIENSHDREFKEALIKYYEAQSSSETETKYEIQRKTDVDKISEDLTTETVIEDTSAPYRCMFCGQYSNEASETCSLCNAIGSFERVS